MQRLFAILLICSLGFHSLAKLGIVAWYEINKDYVADVLCINKDKPDLACNGKCYLRKQLKKADETQNDSQVVNNKIEIAEYLPASLSFNIERYTSSTNKIHIAYYQNTPPQHYIKDIFRPPVA